MFAITTASPPYPTERLAILKLIVPFVAQYRHSTDFEALQKLLNVRSGRSVRTIVQLTTPIPSES